MFTRNEPRLGIMNSDLGTIVALTKNKLQITTDTGQVISVNPREYPHLHLGYALTTYKAQGITVDRSLILVGPNQSRELAYVAASRARLETNWFTTTTFHYLAKASSETRAKQFASYLQPTKAPKPPLNR